MSRNKASRLATVLYEDQCGDALKEFGPHLFVLALVADRTGTSVHDLSGRFEGIARNGVDKLIADCARTGRIAGSGVLWALVDRDRIGEHLKLGKGASDDEVIDAIRARSDQPERLFVAFLEPNMEGLLASIEACGGPPAPKRKRILERDLALMKAAFTSGRDLRDCVRDKQPSLAAMADELAKLVVGG